MENRERQEWALVEEFKTRYDKFPSGNLSKSESPDFLLLSEERKIGIEITRVYHDSFKKSSEIKQRSVFKSRTTDRVIAELSKLLPWPFLIDIQFDPNAELPKNMLDKCVLNTASFCAGEFQDLENRQRRYVEDMRIPLDGHENKETVRILMDQGFRNLPYGIDAIMVTRWDHMGFSWNIQNEGAQCRI